MAGMAMGLQASPQILSLIVACLCFMLAAGFLLFLLPEQWSQTETVPVIAALAAETVEPPVAVPPRTGRIPVQGAGATQFVDLDEVRSIRADAHYTWVHDGNRERMCNWPISEAEATLDPAIFFRVHRSHIVVMPNLVLIRKEGDGAVVELDGPNPHRVPVSRARVAEIKARLRLIMRPSVRR